MKRRKYFEIHVEKKKSMSYKIPRENIVNGVKGAKLKERKEMKSRMRGDWNGELEKGK